MSPRLASSLRRAPRLYATAPISCIACAHGMWCGFSRAVFSPNCLSQPSEQALAGPYTCDAAIFSTAAEELLFWAHTISLVAVPVLAPWRAPTCWGPVMSGNLQCRTIARETGRMQALCKKSRDVLIKVNRAQNRAPQCATAHRVVCRSARGSRSRRTPIRELAGPKKQSRPTPPKRNRGTGSPGRLKRHKTHAIDAREMTQDSRYRHNAGTPQRSASTSASSAPRRCGRT